MKIYPKVEGTTPHCFDGAKISVIVAIFQQKNQL